MKETFNVGNPTKENIDCAFKNLIFYVTASTQLDIYKEKIGSVPVLLLDDIFSELDKKRKNKLIDYINHAGQVIITTNDIRDINRKKLNEAKIFEIKNKKIIEKGDKNGK